MTLPPKMRGRALVFGGSGAIGQSIVARFEGNGWDVTSVTRQESSNPRVISWHPPAPASATAQRDLQDRGPFSAVCWSQGQNFNDSVFDVDEARHLEMYQANVLYILMSLRYLLDADLIAPNARMVVISSIWQSLARQNKLSYTVTKAALHGLVLSAANDLGSRGILVNAVLPGVLETPMTRQNLAAAQIKAVQESTQFARLATLEDVAATTYFLCSAENTGTTGQFIKVDLGYSHVRVI